MDLLGLLSPVPYRRLFAWLTPQAFVGSKIVGPVAQLLLYVYVIRSSGAYDVGFAVIGSALLLTMFGGLYGITFSLLGARRLGVARDARISARGAAGLYVPLAVWSTVDGMVTALAILGLGAALFGVHLADPAGFLLAMLVTALTSTALGVVVAEISNWLRDDGGAVVNAVAFLSTVASGAMIAVADLPAWMRPVSSVWPFTHGLTAARAAAAGHGFRSQILLELTVAAVLTTLGIAVHRVTAAAERRGSRPD